jgi:hypothetical protein
MIKKIKERKLGDKTYQLVCYPGGPIFVIYEVKNNIGTFENYPEVASFDNERDAAEYLEKL